jgi:hypothetical protein
MRLRHFMFPSWLSVIGDEYRKRIGHNESIENIAEVLDNQRNDGWLQITPGERFRIRASVKETKGIYTMLELIADPRNGVPMHIHQRG